MDAITLLNLEPAADHQKAMDLHHHKDQLSDRLDHHLEEVDLELVAEAVAVASAVAADHPLLATPMGPHPGTYRHAHHADPAVEVVVEAAATIQLRLVTKRPPAVLARLC